MSGRDRQKLYEALCAIQNGTTFFDEILTFEFPQARPHVPMGVPPSQRAMQLLQWAEVQDGAVEQLWQAVERRAPASFQQRVNAPHSEVPSMRSLQTLLVSLFDVQDLRQFIAHYYPELQHEILFSAAMSQVAFEVVEKLQKRGLVDDRLWEHLVQERSHRRSDIEQARKQFLGPR